MQIRPPCCAVLLRGLVHSGCSGAKLSCGVSAAYPGRARRGPGRGIPAGTRSGSCRGCSRTAGYSGTAATPSGTRQHLQHTASRDTQHCDTAPRTQQLPWWPCPRQAVQIGDCKGPFQPKLSHDSTGTKALVPPSTSAVLKTIPDKQQGPVILIESS